MLTTTSTDSSSQQGLDRLVGMQVVELGRGLRPGLVDVGTAEDPDRAELA